ncbi:hypothetical protein B4Q04_08905 [Zobellia sp. OII3]|uniref:PAS domain-containing sensor histidine kinase n=1 Tax=Zobellia sp. OII3 TaxID=2034520 RepID=UPI000B52FFC1|nr:PAS domain S-box protein [Zobellia sp. OII3]OWW25712.1 hypothetical protein B4Q04_08905 [Zobellia sp. OII3]
MGVAKNDSKSQKEYQKMFIDQASTAMAMVDNDMRYIAASRSWIKDYGLEGIEIIGRSHYEIFPEIGDDWKAMHKRCLNGATDICEETAFKRKNGSIQWIYWDVRPWFISEDKIGGILMHTGDITRRKEKELEKARIDDIFEKTNEIARIGAWELNLITKVVYWNKITREIHEVSEDFIPVFDNGINFFKEGESRDKLLNAFDNAEADGTHFNLELEIITAKGNVCWTRVVGRAEYSNGKPSRLFGIIQDIDKTKFAEQQLNKAHSELQAIFDSKSIMIVSTDKKGVIKRFNQGAEALLGYSAAEMVGKEKPRLYIGEEEIIKFRNDIAELNGRDPATFDHYVNFHKIELNDTREWTYYKKDGSPVYVISTITGIKNRDNENEGFIAISKDISEIKYVENELLKKNQLLNFAEQISMMASWKWDTVADKVKWSQNFYKILELDEDISDLNFDSYYRFVHPKDIKIVDQHFENVENDKKWESFTHRIITTSGKVKTIQLFGEVFTNEKGQIIEMIGTCQDVTEIKMEERKFRGLLESAPDAMVIVNDKGVIQLINKQSEKLFGYTPEELVNKPVEILIPARFYHKHSNHRNRFFHSPISREMGDGRELFALKKNGKEVPIQISLSPLHTEEGLLVSAAIRDITKQKLAEQKINDAKNNLELVAQTLSAQNKQLADFTHITSHNLRAPVANLNALLQIYDQSENEVDRIDIFSKFKIVVQHLTLTLNTLVDALKTKISDSGEDLEEINLADVLLDTKEILSGAILKSGVIIKSDFSKVSTIPYNRIYMESIFLNLVGNAIKYKSEDRLPEIRITTEIENEKTILKFHDNGLGIDLEQHGHKLFGLNKVFHRHPDAKGVGLFLTRTQIEAMGGVISASSKVNVGTTFTIHFK